MALNPWGIKSFFFTFNTHSKTISITVNDFKNSAQYYPNICSKCSIPFETRKRSLVTSDLKSCIKNVVDGLWQVTKLVEAKVRSITVNFFRLFGAQTNLCCAATNFVFRCKDLKLEVFGTFPNYTTTCVNLSENDA
jgi:hypothetical protein